MIQPSRNDVACASLTVALMFALLLWGQWVYDAGYQAGFAAPHFHFVTNGVCGGIYLPPGNQSPTLCRDGQP